MLLQEQVIVLKFQRYYQEVIIQDMLQQEELFKNGAIIRGDINDFIYNSDCMDIRNYIGAIL